MSEWGQGRLWPAGGWHSRSIPSSGNTRAFRHLRFVPLAETFDFLDRRLGRSSGACIANMVKALSSAFTIFRRLGSRRKPFGSRSYQRRNSQRSPPAASRNRFDESREFSFESIRGRLQSVAVTRTETQIGRRLRNIPTAPGGCLVE